MLPETGAEGALDRSARVAALVGDAANCVFLFERESTGQRSEPVAGSGEGGPSRRCVVLRGRAVGEFECAPADGAVGLVDEGAELLDPVLANERVRVLGIAEQRGLEHA